MANQNAPLDDNENPAMTGIAQNVGIAPVALDLDNPITDSVTETTTYPMKATIVNAFNGAVTIADGADVAEGHIADGAWSGSGSGTLVAIEKKNATNTSSIVTNTSNTATSTSAINTTIGAKTDTAWDGSAASASLIAIEKYIAGLLIIPQVKYSHAIIAESDSDTGSLDCSKIKVINFDFNLTGSFNVFRIDLALQREQLPTVWVDIYNFPTFIAANTGLYNYSLGPGAEYPCALGGNLKFCWRLSAGFGGGTIDGSIVVSGN